MDIADLLPKDKFDDSNIEKIAQLSDDQIQPIIFEMLEWLQDYNYPIANKLLPILLSHEHLIFPYVSDILNGDDIMWKYWVMELLIPNFTCEHKKMLRPNIEHITALSAQDEDTIVIIEQAKKCLIRCFGV